MTLNNSILVTQNSKGLNDDLDSIHHFEFVTDFEIALILGVEKSRTFKC